MKEDEGRELAEKLGAAEGLDDEEEMEEEVDEEN